MATAEKKTVGGSTRSEKGLKYVFYIKKNHITLVVMSKIRTYFEIAVPERIKQSTYIPFIFVSSWYLGKDYLMTMGTRILKKKLPKTLLSRNS